MPTRIAIFLAALLFSSAALATPVSVTPTTINLRPGTASELISLANESDTPARFEVTAFAWQETEDGRTELTPTKDVIVFPALLELPPRGIKKIRLGTERPGAGAEKSYRLVINELPQAAKGAAALQIQVLTNMTLPIFVSGGVGAPKVSIEDTKIENGKLSFAVANGGTSRFVLQRIDVSGSGKGGQAFDVTQKGWYVLAGGKRRYEVTLGGARCRQAEAITIKAVTDGPVGEARLALPASACGDGAVVFLDSRAAGDTKKAPASAP